MPEAVVHPSRIWHRRSIRSRVLGMTVALAFITYLDRVCISVTAPTIQCDLHLSTVQMGFVFSAFTAAYALFEIPTGWWADRRGSRHVLSRIVLWWSSFTALTGLAVGFRSSRRCAGLFGAGEAGAWPTVARALARWFPVQERGSAQGIFFMGAHLGGGLTPLLVAVLAARVGWRATFPLLSIVGVLWVLAWRRWYWDEPRDHTAVTPGRGHSRGLKPAGVATPAAERASEPILRTALRTPGVWFLCLMYFTQTYGFNLYVTWMPTLFAARKAHAWNGVGYSCRTATPAQCSSRSVWRSADRPAQPRGSGCARAVAWWASFPWRLPASFSSVALSRSGIISAVLIALAAASSNFLLGASWGTCADMAGDHAGYVERSHEYFRADRWRAEPDCVRIPHCEEGLLGERPFAVNRGVIDPGGAVCWVFCASRTSSGNERAVASHDLQATEIAWRGAELACISGVASKRFLNTPPSALRQRNRQSGSRKTAAK